MHALRKVHRYLLMTRSPNRKRKLQSHKGNTARRQLKFKRSATNPSLKQDVGELSFPQRKPPLRKKKCSSEPLYS